LATSGTKYTTCERLRGSAASSSSIPSAFAAQEAGWPRYFLGEPGLHVGVHL